MGFFDGPGAGDIKNWVCVLERGTEYEVAMAKNYLSNLKIPSNILSKRDSAYSLNIGEMSMVYLYVPREFEKAAREALQELEDAEGFEGLDEEDWDTEGGQPGDEGGEEGDEGGEEGDEPGDGKEES